jgi:hypothetical protein
MVRGHRFVQQTAVPQYLDQTREGFGLLSTLSQPLEETYHGFPRLSAIGLQLRSLALTLLVVLPSAVVTASAP